MNIILPALQSTFIINAPRIAAEFDKVTTTNCHSYQ